MTKNVIIATTGFIAGILSGYAINAVPNPTENLSETTSMPATHTPHLMTEIDHGQPVPTVSVEVIPDAKDGYNIHVTTENFTFTPEAVNTDPVSNEGHAHLYVNGVKYARLYSDWFQLPRSALVPGENRVEVTLNANDHSEWAIGEQHLNASTTIHVLTE